MSLEAQTYYLQAQVDRQAVVDEALSWVGTPYHSHARIKGVGVDCAHILAAVYETAGLVPAVELGAYPAQWHLHRSEELYTQRLAQLGAEQLPAGFPPLPGDLGVWRFGRTFSHGGIVIEGGANPLVVHAYIGRGVIVSRLNEDPLAGREHSFWSVI